MARASKVAAKPKKKTVRVTRRGTNKMPLMPLKGITWNKAKLYTHYEVESKEWLSVVKEYIKKHYDKKTVSAINKLPDWKIGNSSHWTCTAYLLDNNPDIVPDAYREGIHTWILKLAEEGATIAEAKKAEEKAKPKNIHKPSIQERIYEQAQEAVEDIDEWLEGFIQDPKTFDPKGFDFKGHFTKKGVTQAHARKMKKFYDTALDDFRDLQRMPTAGQLKKMTEQEADLWAQLKEGYSHLKKADINKYIAAIESLVEALDFVIESSKAQRKPRVAKPKSADKLVEKLKYAKTDEKYKLASVNPIEIIGASEVWVFNVKTRKLGKYVASNVDPKGMKRDGTGLTVKGTTIQGFDEKLSIQKTLRKPEETLKEFKSAGKVKLRKFLEELSTTDTKLNGRINADTVILKCV